jgi:hypothetical protein
MVSGGALKGVYRRWDRRFCVGIKHLPGERDVAASAFGLVLDFVSSPLAPGTWVTSPE